MLRWWTQHKFLIFRVATKGTLQIETEGQKSGVTTNQPRFWKVQSRRCSRRGAARPSCAVVAVAALLLFAVGPGTCTLLLLLLLLGGAAAVGQETRVRPHAAARRPGCRQRR